MSVECVFTRVRYRGSNTHTSSHGYISAPSCNNASLAFNSCPKDLEADSRWREMWKLKECLEQQLMAGERGSSGVRRHRRIEELQNLVKKKKNKHNLKKVMKKHQKHAELQRFL